MSDSLRPRGTVQRTCTKCEWSMWFDPLHSNATAIPFVCDECLGIPRPVLVLKGGHLVRKEGS